MVADAGKSEKASGLARPGPRLTSSFLKKRARPMHKFLVCARQFLASEDGPTAVEYAVMLALIIVVCLTAVQAIGTNANATFQSVPAKLPAGAAS